MEMVVHLIVLLELILIHLQSSVNHAYNLVALAQQVKIVHLVSMDITIIQIPVNVYRLVLMDGYRLEMSVFNVHIHVRNVKVQYHLVHHVHLILLYF